MTDVHLAPLWVVDVLAGLYPAQRDVAGPGVSFVVLAHHIVPKGHGGTHDYSNLITTCEPCPAAIHNEGVMAPTASVAERAPSVDVLSAAKEAKKTYRSVKRIMRLFR